MNMLLSDVEEEKGKFEMSDVDIIDELYLKTWQAYLTFQSRHQCLKEHIDLTLSVVLNETKVEKTKLILNFII